jgi:hypothetical protein
VITVVLGAKVREVNFLRVLFNREPVGSRVCISYLSRKEIGKEMRGKKKSKTRSNQEDDSSGCESSKYVAFGPEMIAFEGE